MKNTISLDQNEKDNLKCLAAQRTLYSKAKALFSFQILLCVIIVILTLFTLFIPNLKSFTAFFSISLAFAELTFFNGTISRLKNKAASIQELFDCNVLRIDWNSLKIPSKPDYEDINSYSTSIMTDPDKKSSLEDWYGRIPNEIPYTTARIICQRSNLFWDIELRHSFANATKLASFLLVLPLVIITVCDGITLTNVLFLFLSPTLPIIILALLQHINNKESIENLRRLKQTLDTVWEELLHSSNNEKHFYEASRNIQDEIYSQRKSNPLIFNWFYEIKKNKQQEDTNYTVSQMVKEYIESQ